MALRAAHNAGIHVPKATFDKAVEYVMNSQNHDGGFMYMLSAGGPSDVSPLGRRRRRPQQRRHLPGPAKQEAVEEARNFEPAGGDQEGPGLPQSVPPGEGRGAARRSILSNTATTTRCRRCGRPAASVGQAGIRPSATTFSPGRARTAPGARLGLRRRVRDRHVPARPANAGKPVAHLPAVNVR